MNKTLKFILITAWIVFSRGYDVYATYQFTPNLEKEANPLASVLGLGWSPILLIVGILTLAIIYNYYIATFKPIQLLPTEKGYNFRMVTTYIYLGKTDEWKSMFYKLPKSRKRLQHYLGHILTRALAFAGIVSTIMWLLIKYTSFYKQYHSAAAIYSILIIGFVFITIQWHKKMYRQYILQTESVNTSS